MIQNSQKQSKQANGLTYSLLSQSICNLEKDPMNVCFSQLSKDDETFNALESIRKKLIEPLNGQINTITPNISNIQQDLKKLCDYILQTDQNQVDQLKNYLQFIKNQRNQYYYQKIQMIGQFIIQSSFTQNLLQSWLVKKIQFNNQVAAKKQLTQLQKQLILTITKTQKDINNKQHSNYLNKTPSQKSNAQIAKKPTEIKKQTSVKQQQIKKQFINYLQSQIDQIKKAIINLERSNTNEKQFVQKLYRLNPSQNITKTFVQLIKLMYKFACWKQEDAKQKKNSTTQLPYNNNLSKNTSIHQGQLEKLKSRQQQLKLQINKLKQYVDDNKTNKKQNKINKMYKNSQIIDQNSLRNSLNQLLQDCSKKKIKQTQLLYKSDLLNKQNFHSYIDKQRNILLLAKTSKGKIIGGFQTQPFNDISTQKQSAQKSRGFLFDLKQNKVYKKFPTQTNNKYNIDYIIFGNLELRIKFGELNIQSYVGIKNKMYDTGQLKRGTFLGQKEQESTSTLLNSYQVYRIFFEEDDQNQIKQKVPIGNKLQLNNLEQLNKKLKLKIDNLQTCKKVSQKQIQKLKNQIKQKVKEKEKEKEKQQQLNNLQQLNKKLKLKIDNLQSCKKVSQKQIQKLKNQISSIRKQIKNQIEGKNQYYKKYQNLNDLNTRINLKVQNINKQKEILEIQLRKQIQLFKKNLQKKNQEIKQLKNHFQQQKDQYMMQNTMNKKKIEELIKQIKNLTETKVNKFFNNQILQQDQDSKQYLVQILQSKLNKKIKMTTFKYKYDILNRVNFHQYLDNIENLVLIIQLKNKMKIAAYSQSAFYKGDLRGVGYIISLTNQKIFGINQRNPSSKAIIYDQYFIIYGNSELRIKSNENKIFSNFGIVNNYYETNNETVDVLFSCGPKERQVQFQSFEFYKIVFQN